MDDVSELRELERLRQLKARYFRLMDTKEWDEYRTLFTDDMKFWRDQSPARLTPEPVTTTGDSFVERVSSWLATAVTVHHGHMAELEILGPTEAHGIWALFDWVDNPDRDRAFQGYGHYHERYVKGRDGSWRISEMRLTRLRIVELPVTSLQDVEAARRRWHQR